MKRVEAVRHTPEFISRVFDEELERLLQETQKEADPAAQARLREARRMSEEMIRSGEFDPGLILIGAASERVLLN